MMLFPSVKQSFGRLLASRPLLNRGFSLFPSLAIKNNKLPPRPKIVEDEIEEKFLKGGRGPGGQKINKTNSKVQLKHIPTGIVVTCQETRSQDQNRKRAREILAAKVQHALDPENSRQTIVQEWKHNKRASKKKKSRRKYRKLEEEKKKLQEQESGIVLNDETSTATPSEQNENKKSPITDALTNAIVNSVD